MDNNNGVSSFSSFGPTLLKTMPAVATPPPPSSGTWPPLPELIWSPPSFTSLPFLTSIFFPHILPKPSSSIPMHSSISPFLHSPQYLHRRRPSSTGGEEEDENGDGEREPWGGGGWAKEAEEREKEREREEEERRKARDEEQLRLAGLRRQALLGLFCWLAILAMIALFLLGLHISLLLVLQMSPRGMRSLRIFSYENSETGREEPAVHFTAPKVHLGRVVASSGKVLGPRDKGLSIRGTRVLIAADNGNGTRMVWQEGGQCRMEGAEQFQIRQPGTGKVLFSARHPLVSIDRRIKRIASGHIVTNKLRAPVDEELRIVGQDVSLRGNERIRMEAKRLNASANRIGLKTTDDGSIRLAARRLFVGSKWHSLPVSSSPALTASIDAFRVCLCQNRPKLFLVPGNRPCGATSTICQ